MPEYRVFYEGVPPRETWVNGRVPKPVRNFMPGFRSSEEVQSWLRSLRKSKYWHEVKILRIEVRPDPAWRPVEDLESWLGGVSV